MQHSISPRTATLGAPIGEYRFHWRLALCLFTAFAFGCGYAFWAVFTSSQRDIVLMIVLGGMTILMAGMVPFIMFRTACRVQFFEDGMLEERLYMSQTFRWEDAVHVTAQLNQFNGIAQVECKRWRNGWQTRLAGRGGSFSDEPLRPGVFNRLTLNDAVMMMMEATEVHRFNSALAQYKAGQQVDFKKFKISRDGIQVKNNLIPWSLVSDIETDGDVLLIQHAEQTKPWNVLALAGVYDGDTLPLLIAHTQGSRYKAFQERTITPNVIAAQHARMWRGRLLRWVLLPLLIIGVNIGWRYGTYLMSAQANIDRGNAFMADGNYTAALEEYNTGIARAPDMPVLYLNRGMAYRELGRFDEALAQYDMALRLRPDYPAAFVHRGRVYYRQGDYNRAIAEYNAVVARHPMYYFSYCNLGYAYKKLGDNRTALANFQRCHDLTREEHWKVQSAREIAALQPVR